MFTNQILDVFENYRMPPLLTDRYEQKGKQVLAGKLDVFVEKQEPIEFVMLGYPAKSPNVVHKVLGPKPDLGEEVSLINFADFARNVKAVYEPGVKISIVSDGFIFSDLLDISDNTVEQYEEICIDMAKVAPIQWYDVRAFYAAGKSLDCLRRRVTNQFGISAAMLEQRIITDQDVNSLYKGMIRFLQGDLEYRPFASKNQLQVRAKQLAKEMMFRNEAYSNLIKSEFKTQIRLSMHPSINCGSKYSFQLIPGKKAYTSPWHCALFVHPNGEYETIHKKDAEAAELQLVYKDKQPYYYFKNDGND